MSIGMGMTFVPLTLLATTNVDAEDAGLASGLFNTSQQVGGALGLAVLSTIATSRTSHLLGNGVGQASAMTRGYTLAFGGAAALLVAGIVTVALFIRREDVTQINAARGSRTSLMVTVTRELRVDAQRNLARILEAAREVFAEQGIDAPIVEIAHRAGVGVGTIFRRFPNKDELIVALLEQRGAQLLEAADAALASDDPGAAFRRLLEDGVAMQISDRGLCDAIGTDLLARDELRSQFDEVHAKLVALLRRAQDAAPCAPTPPPRICSSSSTASRTQA